MAPLIVRSAARAAAVTNRERATARPAFDLPLPPAGTAQLPAGISLCMIVKDEERFLEACLRSSAPYVDEICIVDTGSTDRTLEIAAAFGARVEHRPWRNDFAWARNEVLGMATKRWVFVLDADEELDPASGENLRGLRTVPAHLAGLWVRCQNLSDDYKGTGVATHALVRIFPNNARVRYQSPVHEFISLDGLTTGIEARISTISITHHGYLSEIVKARNKSERNLALVKAAAAADPHDPFNWYNLGTTSLLSGDRPGAIEALETMCRIVGDAPRGFVPNAFAQLADLYTDNGDYERAVECAQQSLKKAPHFANAHFALGRALAKAKRHPEARAAFLAAIADGEHAARQFIVDDEVSTWKAHSEIGSSYGHEGNDAAALEWFDRALVDRPNVVPLRVNRARALERLGRFAEARSTFAALAREEPGEAHSVDYINYLLRRKEFVAAGGAIEDALSAVSPRVAASLLVAAAQVAAQTGLGSPEALLLRALDAHGGTAEALDGLEALYHARGDTAAIEQLHARELSAPVTTAADHARRGARQLAIGDLEAAQAVTAAGLLLASDDPALHYNFGAILVQRDQKAEALEHLLQAGTAGDTGLRALYLSSMVLSDIGRAHDALERIERFIELRPDESEARLHRFRLNVQLGNEAGAEADLRHTLEVGDTRITVELAAALLQAGRFDEARAVADLALAVTSSSAASSHVMAFVPTDSTGTTGFASTEKVYA